MTYEEALNIVRTTDLKLVATGDKEITVVIVAMEKAIAAMEKAKEGLPENGNSVERNSYEQALSHLVSFLQSLRHLGGTLASYKPA